MIMALSLNKFDRDEFLYIQKQLILFTNEKFKIYDKFKTLKDIVNLSREDIEQGILPIRKEMYDASHIQDFCEKNNVIEPIQKTLVKSWSMAYTDDFYIVRHLKDSTLLLTGNEKKLYRVVGISNGLNEFFPDQALPIVIRTTLLPFKQQIVYDGFFSFHPIYFGGNITKRLKQVYTDIKGEKGVILQPEENIFLGDLEPRKPDGEAIKFFIKQELKSNHFPSKAWELANKSPKNRLLFEHEYARIFAKYQVDALKNYNEIKSMYYAAYRSCIIGVSDNKKSLLAFCVQHFPEISRYVYIFKA
jgi:hypothetical protein